MHPLIDQRGLSLVEILFAGALVSIVVMVMSLTFPKMSASTLTSQQRAVASNLASTQVESLSSQVYLKTATTDSDPTLATAFDTQCDCRTVNWNQLPPTTSVASGTTYQMRSCIHMVQIASVPQWGSQCSSIGDTGYKNIVVRVEWIRGDKTNTVFQESTITRF